MVSVVITNNTNRETVIVPDSQTVRQTLENAGVDYTRGATRMDGSSLGVGDLDKTFAQLGITERCYLSQVVKADNA